MNEHLYTQEKQLTQMLERSHLEWEKGEDLQEHWITFKSESATCTFVFELSGQFKRIELSSNFYSD